MKTLSRKLHIAVITSVSLISTAQTFAAETTAKTGQTNVWDLIQKGGVVMIPIAILSIIAMALSLERAINLTKNKVVPKQFMRDLKDAQGGGDKHDYHKAYDFCEHSQTPIGRIIQTGFGRLKIERRLSEVEKFIGDVAAREVGKMKRSLRGLKVIAGVTPMLGLTGTVYGLIRVFQQITNSPNIVNKTAVLSSGIYEAMVTTAAGLTIAIPVLLIYHYLNNKVDSHAHDIEIACEEFLAEYIDAKLGDK